MTPKHHRTTNILRLFGALLLCILVCVQAASAIEYTLSAADTKYFSTGISYDGEEDLVLIIEDDSVITASGNAGIESAAPVTIRSPNNARLTITVGNDSDTLYGIKAPSVTIESGTVDITVATAGGSRGGGAAYGIYAESGNVTIPGGTVAIRVETPRHKNKGIYAARYIGITGGRVTATAYGGSNTFGLDGGDVLAGDSDGGIVISGGYISVDSGGAATRNYGIDSKYGSVIISGNPVLYIHEDESGAKENFAYNENVTTITGGNAVVFAKEGAGNYLLREDAVLTQDAALLPGEVFEIPAGMTLGISGPVSLTRPASSGLLFGGSHGTFTYANISPADGGGIVYAGEEPAAQASPVPVAGVLAGLGAVILLKGRR